MPCLGLGLTLAARRQATAAGGLGAELLLNGGFDTDTVWTKTSGWTISGGTANIALTGGTRNLTQGSLTLTQGITYQLTYTVSNYTAGTVTPAIIGGTVVAGAARSANGTYTETIVAGPTPTAFRFQAAINTSLSIDNVSLREVL